MKNFHDIIEIARTNVRKNPDIVNEDVIVVSKRYLSGLIDEVGEVRNEVKERNEVYLTDELSDIAWDYAVLLSLLEDRGLIPSVEKVIEHAHHKYTERSIAFSESDSVLWDKVKQTQKQELNNLHKNTYGA